jgi:hypothetical protein
MIFNITCIGNMLELQLKMDSLGYSHVKSDMVHNFIHGLFIVDYPNLSTIKPQKIKPSSHID